MAVISAGDLTLLRADDHRTVERLYTLGFPTVWTGRVNEEPARGDRTITYDGGAMASNFAFADILPGLEVWFGSGAGLNNLGVRRLRSISGTATSGTIVIDWHDDIDMADDNYITIKHVYGPWAKYSHFTAAGPTFKKDGPDGTIYTDENEDSPPLVIMGRNYAAEDAATITIDVSDSVATASGATINTNVAWSFTPSSLAGVSLGSTTAQSTTLTLPANSKVWLHCTITDDNNNTATGHRCFITGGGITEFTRGPLTHRFGDTNVGLDITTTSDTITWDDFRDRSLIIITATDYYGSTQKTITFRDDARYTDRNHIVFSGYLKSESWRFGAGGSGIVQMRAITLLPMFLYSVSLTGSSSPTEWTEMHTTLMTVAGNLFHLFNFHSTLLEISDFQLPWADTVKRSANDEFAEGNLLQKAAGFASKRFMVLTGTPQGEIFVEEDLNLADDTTRGAATTIMTLTDADVQFEKNAIFNRDKSTVVVTLSGGSSTGTPGTFTPLFSTSQTVALAQGNPSKRTFDRMMLADQDDANDKSGRQAAVINRIRVALSQLKFRGHYREVISPAKQEWFDLGNVFDDALSGNLRGSTALENYNAVVRSVTVSPVVNGAYTVTADFDIEAPAVASGVGGVTVPAPTVPDTTDSTTGNYDDPWNLPTNTEVPTGTGALIVLNDDTSIYVSEDGGDSYTTRSV